MRAAAVWQGVFGCDADRGGTGRSPGILHDNRDNLRLALRRLEAGLGRVADLLEPSRSKELEAWLNAAAARWGGAAAGGTPAKVTRIEVQKESATETQRAQRVDRLSVPSVSLWQICLCSIHQRVKRKSCIR